MNMYGKPAALIRYDIIAKVFLSLLVQYQVNIVNKATKLPIFYRVFIMLWRNMHIVSFIIIMYNWHMLPDSQILKPFFDLELKNKD